MLIKNQIEAQYKKFVDNLSIEYVELYSDFDNEKLRILFSTLYRDMISSFDTMNERLPTKNNFALFWAEPSRTLLKVIESTESLYRTLKNSKYGFCINEYYQQVINDCKQFLKRSGGSIIPPQMDKIELYYILPIFIPQNSVVINNSSSTKHFNLVLIGEGSYAYVYKYHDDFYNKNFVLKRAKKDLDNKELERFSQEFETMNQLVSPYIVEVYNYDKDKNEYIMEYMDCSLYDYIQKHNAKLALEQRKNIATQILKAFSYLHSKNILHRDISLKNILVKKYEHLIVVKISDFGLVKLPHSHLTSANTDFKGSLNDPALQHEGFDNYSLCHEIYALTQVLYYIYTGKVNIGKISDEKLKNFILKGMNPTASKRFDSVAVLLKAFNQLFTH